MLEGIKVLVVDDEEVICNLLTDVLGDEGCEVTAVARGAEAVVKVREETFDIVFSDVHMPGMNGAETVKAIKEIRPQTVVVMTDSYPNHLLAQAREAGAIICIHKPFNIKDVVNIVKEMQLLSHQGKQRNLVTTWAEDRR